MFWKLAKKKSKDKRNAVKTKIKQMDSVNGDGQSGKSYTQIRFANQKNCKKVLFNKKIGSIDCSKHNKTQKFCQ